MINSPRFAFFGTPDFSVRILNILEEHGLAPEVVISSPDRPRGRGQKLQPTPVKSWAQQKEIPVLTPDKLNQPEFLETLRDYELDCSVVAAYGKIIPESVLSTPRYGSINVHPSLLPKYRGASPIESQILADEEDIGVTIMFMDEKMDHGPILAQESINRPSSIPDAIELEKILADLGGELLAESLISYIGGEIDPKEQDHEEATYTPKIKKEDAKISLSDDPYHNFLKIRAYKRFRPHFFAEFKGKNVRVVVTKVDYNKKDNKLLIEKVIPEGAKEMDFEEFKKSADL
ncbi:MAG: methionyl-tRNA formyltransferase [Candidatus Campbellbacteria bacterium]|nr:methionyl-tRNA formyltransferase [Candidatus Campbellbacteria bacterium]